MRRFAQPLCASDAWAVVVLVLACGAPDSAAPGRAGLEDGDRAAVDAGLPGTVSDAASLPAQAGHDAGASDAATLGAHPSDASAPDGASAGGATRFASVAVTAPPSYLGTTGSSAACTQPARTAGFAPDGPAGMRYPLFLYFVGTSGGASDASARYDCEAGKKVTEAMARRGFVALSVEYDNSLFAILTNKFDCLYVASNPNSLLAKACAMPNVDCAQGIATWGHSQGALLAHGARNYDPRHRASWTTGYGGIDIAMLPHDRLRVVNAENDVMNASVSTLNKASGSACPADGRTQCLRPDGSGWILVKKADCRRSAADHCWFDKLSCAESSEVLEPSWVDADSTAPFALEANADWVAATVARPR